MLSCCNTSNKNVHCGWAKCRSEDSALRVSKQADFIKGYFTFSGWFSLKKVYEISLPNQQCLTSILTPYSKRNLQIVVLKPSFQILPTKSLDTFFFVFVFLFACVKSVLGPLKKKKNLFYGQTDMPIRVGRSGVCFVLFLFFFPFLVAKMTLKTQKFQKKLTFFCRKVLGEYFDFFSKIFGRACKTGFFFFFFFHGLMGICDMIKGN